MAGTTQAALKANLKTRLAVRPGLSSVQVGYGDPGGTSRRQRVWLGSTTDGEVEPVALRAGRRRRDETYVLKVHVEVIAAHPTPEGNEARAVELVREVEECLADDPTVGAVPNLLWAVVSALGMDTTETPDGPRTVVTLDLTAHARLL